jgi:hypothetical protein
MITVIRNTGVLVLLYFAGWWAVMATRFLVPTAHSLVPRFAGRYSIGIAEFALALLPAILVGLLASVAFAGPRRLIWVWVLAVILFLQGVFGVGTLLPDESSTTWLVMVLLEFSPFLLVGLTAVIAHRLSRNASTQAAA